MHLCRFLSTSRVRESGPPIFSLFRLRVILRAAYAIDDIYGGAGKVASDLSGLIGS